MAIDTWENMSRLGKCCACEKALVENESYFGTLFDSAEGFDRRDYCVDCWNGDEGAHSDAFSFWQAKMPVREAKKKLFVDNMVLKQIFRRLATSDDEEKKPFTFVLALILMRKRLVRYVETERQGDDELWIVRITGEDEKHRIYNPQLAEEEVARVQEQLNEVLAGD